MTIEGALLKVSAEDNDLTVPAGKPFDVRLQVSRLSKLAEPVRLELRLTEGLTGKLKAKPVTVPVKKEKVVFLITPAADLRGLHTITIRATALQDGKYPAISEATVAVELAPAGTGSRKQR
jgi:hypothetical protein